jgi:hypothetical protein
LTKLIINAITIVLNKTQGKINKYGLFISVFIHDKAKKDQISDQKPKDDNIGRVASIDRLGRNKCGGSLFVKLQGSIRRSGVFERVWAIEVTISIYIVVLVRRISVMVVILTGLTVCVATAAVGSA